MIAGFDQFAFFAYDSVISGFVKIHSLEFMLALIPLHKYMSRSNQIALANGFGAKQFGYFLCR